MKVGKLIKELKEKGENSDDVILFFGDKWTDQIFVFEGTEGEVWISPKDLAKKWKEKSSKLEGGFEIGELEFEDKDELHKREEDD